MTSAAFCKFADFSSLPQTIGRTMEEGAAVATGPLRVLVVGGGPVGLTFAILLKSKLGRRASITVSERRWTGQGDGLRWQNLAEGVRRRQQVVTMQSAIWGRLPTAMQAALFPAAGYAQSWPVNQYSPRSLGFPRNTRICDIEDRLLAMAKCKGLDLVAGRIDPEHLDLSNWDFVAICDGAQSPMRAHFSDAFEDASSAPEIGSTASPVDHVLALKIKTQLTDVEATLLSLTQNRFLFNGINGEGYLCMRLTQSEATALKLIGPGGPPRDMPISIGPELCPAVQDGLRLFSANPDPNERMRAFGLSPVSRRRFTGRLRRGKQGATVPAALLGDAASALHFWAGIGLNQGFQSAMELAEVLYQAPRTRGIGLAELEGYDARMHRLQKRYKSRALRAMCHDTSGASIASLIEAAQQKAPGGRDGLIAEMKGRLSQVAERLEARMPAATALCRLEEQLQKVRADTLSVLLASGAWRIRARAMRSL